MRQIKTCCKSNFKKTYNSFFSEYKIYIDLHIMHFAQFKKQSASTCLYHTSGDFKCVIILTLTTYSLSLTFMNIHIYQSALPCYLFSFLFNINIS